MLLRKMVRRRASQDFSFAPFNLSASNLGTLTGAVNPNSVSASAVMQGAYGGGASLASVGSPRYTAPPSPRKGPVPLLRQQVGRRQTAE